MIIDRIEITEFTVPIRGLGVESGGAGAVTNICADPAGELPVSKFAIVIQTSDGARGEYVGQWGATKATLGQAIMMAPFLIGRDVHTREALFDDLKREFRQYDHMAHGHFDIALWDLIGKSLNASVCSMLGAYRTRLPAYASTYHAQASPHGLHDIKDFVAFAGQCVELGYRAFKVHGWHDGNVQREAENLRAIRTEVGREVDIMIDPACQLRTFQDALQLGLVCDEVGCRWYEDPFRDSGVSAFAHQRLRERLRTPLLVTEHVRGIEPKADFVLSGGTDILRADPEYDLGITGCMKIAHFAEALGLDVEVHAAGPAHRHCMAAIRNTNYYEVALVGPKMPNALPEIYASPYSDQIECIGADGCVDVPAGPGLGVEYDWDKIGYHTTNVTEFVS